MPADEFDKSFTDLISKLGHQVEEIRIRALDNLVAKFDLHLLNDVDVVQYKFLYIKLLEWFNFSSPSKRDVVLDILLKLSKHESAAINLHSIGAIDFLNALRPDLTPDLERKIDQILDNILSQHSIQSPPYSHSNSYTLRSDNQSHISSNSNQDLFQLPTLNISQQNTNTLTTQQNLMGDTLLSGLQNLSSINHSKHTNMDSITKHSHLQHHLSLSNLSASQQQHQRRKPMQQTPLSTARLISSSDGEPYIIPQYNLFRWVQLRSSDRTVLSTLENSLTPRNDVYSTVISHCNFLSNVVLNDFPSEIFLQRPLVVKRLLALLNENNSDVITAALSCLKELCFHLHKRIKMLRDPFTFCLNNFTNSKISADQINNGKEDLNLTIASARSVSSINSTTSNGYPRLVREGQRNSNYSNISTQDERNESLEEQQQTQYDIIEFCYSILINTFDLLRRLTNKDHLCYCLQLNNFACQIITIHIQHNYGTISYDLYSMFYYRLHSLIKQQLVNGNTFQSRIIYVHCLHVFCVLVNTMPFSNELSSQLPQEFNEILYYILMDECFHISYPLLRNSIIKIAEQIDPDNYHVYIESDNVCQSFTSACQLLSLNENDTQNTMKIINLADVALLGIPYHYNFTVIKRFINACSRLHMESSIYDKSSKQHSIDILLKYMKHEQPQIRTSVYHSLAMLITSRLSIDETTKPKKNLASNHFNSTAANYDETQFLINIRLLTDIVISGMNDLATKVSDYSRLILLHLLQCKLLVSKTFWKNLITIIGLVLPQLQCYSSKIDPLGQCILHLSSDTDIEQSIFTLNQRLQASFRYLFSKDKDVRKAGYRQCVGYLLYGTKIRLDDFYQLYSADNVCDLFIKQFPSNLDNSIESKELINIEKFLRVYTIFSSTDTIDSSVRKSALDQISTILQDPSLHTSFLTHGGFEKILQELQNNLKKDSIICEVTTNDFHSTITSCVKIIRLLTQYNRQLQKKFSYDNDLMKLLFKVAVCCHDDIEICYNIGHILTLLLFDKTLNSDQEVSSQSFSVDFLMAKYFQFPFRVQLDTSLSSSITTTTTIKKPDPLCEPIVQQKFRFFWNVLWHGSIDQLDNDMDTSSYSKDMQVDFESSMILTESDRKCFSLTYPRRTIRLQLSLLSEAENHSSVIETLQGLTCLLLLSNNNVHLIEYNQLGNLLDHYLNIAPSSSNDEKLLQTIFETLEIISVCFLNSSTAHTDYFDWIKHVLLNPSVSILDLNRDLCDTRQTKRDLLKKFFRFLSVYYTHSTVTSECFTDKLFNNILNYVKQTNHTFSKLALILGAIDVLQQITNKDKWWLIFDNDQLYTIANLLIDLICSFHEGRKEASSAFMAHAVTRTTCQTLLNVLIAMKHLASVSNRKELTNESSSLNNWLQSLTSLKWLKPLWKYDDIQVRTTSYALLASIISQPSGRTILFSNDIRGDTDEEERLLYMLFNILLDKYECSYVKEQICNVLISITDSMIIDESTMTNNNNVTVAELLCVINEIEFFTKIGSIIMSNFYPFITLNINDLRIKNSQEDKQIENDNIFSSESLTSPMLLGNICSLLYNLTMLSSTEFTIINKNEKRTINFARVLITFLDVRPLSSNDQQIISDNEYQSYVDEMFYMYSAIANFLCLIYDIDSTKSVHNYDYITVDILTQIVSLLGYTNEKENYNPLKYFWQTKINVSQLLTNILLYCSTNLRHLTIYVLTKYATSLFEIISLSNVSSPSSNTTISSILHLLALCIAQSVGDEQKQLWIDYFDKTNIQTISNGTNIFNQLLTIYESLLNIESTDTYKLIVSNMLKSLLHISQTAKQEAIKNGFIESQMDHLKRVQTKLTLYSLQTDKCVGKDDVLIDECIQVLTILNNMAYDCTAAKDALETNGIHHATRESLYTQYLQKSHLITRNSHFEYLVNQEVLATSGLISYIHQIWCWAVVDVQLLNAILLVLATITAKNRKGCVSVCATFLPSTTALTIQSADQQRTLSNLLSYVLKLITKQLSRQISLDTAFDLIQNCCIEIEGRSILYKSNFLQSFVNHFERLTKEPNKYDKRWLDILINVSFFADGQTALLKHANIFNILIRLAQSSPISNQRQTLLILRNLAFSPNHKARLLGESKYIPTLMAHFFSKMSDMSYTALTAVWALIVDSQKAKVAIRSTNILPMLFELKTNVRNHDNLLCYHAVSNVIQLLTED